MSKRFVLHTILFALLGIIHLNLSAQNLQDKNTIQIVSSFDYEHEWGQTLAKKIKKELESSMSSFRANINYSDITPAIWQYKKPALMIVIGSEAWNTLKGYKDTGLLRIPMILCGITQSQIEADSIFLKRDNTAAVTLNDNIEQTLQLITTTIPDVENIIYLSELSHDDFFYATKLDDIINSKYPSCNFTVLKTGKINKEYLISIENNINKPHTAVIMNNYSFSNNLNHLTAQLNRSINVPIFALKYKYMNNVDFITGGIFEPIPHYSAKITAVVTEMLNGTTPAKIQEGAVPVTYISKKADAKYNLKTNSISALTFVNIPESKAKFYAFVAVGAITIPLLLIIFIVLIIRTIKSKKRISRDLENYSASFNKYNIIYKNIPVGLGLFDEEGILKDANTEFMKVVKIILPNFRLSGKFNLFHSKLITSDIITTLSKKSTAETILTINSDNQKMSYRLIFHSIEREREKQLLILIYDITQPVNEQERMDRLNSVFTKALSESRLGVAEIDLISGKCTATDGWYKGLSVLKESSLEKCLANVAKEDKENIFKFIEKAVCSNATKTTEDIRVLHLDASCHWIKLILKIKECDIENKKIICSAVLVDIDARKQKEEQLKETYMKIVMSNRIKNSFISNMNHEIRTPLNAIVGFSELLIESQDAEEQKELLKYLEENNEKFLKLITNIVDMSKIESGSVRCTMSEIDLNELLEESVKNIEQQVNPNNIKILFPHQNNCIVYSDKERLQQVINIFLSNAVKYTEKGSIELGYKVLQKKVQLYVKDTGCGIADDQKEKLFSRFVKLESQYMGLGLGLPMANSIIKLLNGAIGFESVVNEGSTFWCVIPSEYIGSDKEIGITGKLENATMHIGSHLKTMLIAEDNENNFQLLNFILKGKFKIVHAVNGENAVELYKQHNPDIILMDIKMPVMDGYQATAAIRELSQDIPIIAVTAYAFNQDREKIMDKHFTDFIAKPVRENELLDTINKALKK
jgi:CheY-like chemotaxis protein/nitrogen-specific signal transduction histidine kinase